MIEMSENVRDEQQLKQDLNILFEIISSYKKHYFYNNNLVDPYVPASFGLCISKKRVSTSAVHSSAVCSSQNCNLSIDFDTLQQSEEKQELEQVIRKHEPECKFAKVKKNLISFELFSRLGKTIYQDHLMNLQNKKVWIQLNPKEILSALNKEEEGKLNKILEQFRQLDANIKGEALTKVTSSIFLAVFGWSWVDKNLLSCNFCGSSKEVTEFISPLQCSLLTVKDGFHFISSHQPWCCLIAPFQQYWKQILREAVIQKLVPLEGKMSQNEICLQSKVVQRNMIDIYREHYATMSSFRKELSTQKENIKKKYEKWQSVEEKLQKHVQELEQVLQEQKQMEQVLIRSTVIDI